MCKQVFVHATQVLSSASTSLHQCPRGNASLRPNPLHAKLPRRIASTPHRASPQTIASNRHVSDDHLLMYNCITVNEASAVSVHLDLHEPSGKLATQTETIRQQQNTKNDANGRTCSRWHARAVTSVRCVLATRAAMRLLQPLMSSERSSRLSAVGLVGCDG